jgi:hypothetical protein
MNKQPLWMHEDGWGLKVAGLRPTKARRGSLLAGERPLVGDWQAFCFACPGEDYDAEPLPRAAGRHPRQMIPPPFFSCQRRNARANAQEGLVYRRAYRGWRRVDRSRQHI